MTTQLTPELWRGNSRAFRLGDLAWAGGNARGLSVCADPSNSTQPFNLTLIDHLNTISAFANLSSPARGNPARRASARNEHENKKADTDKLEC
jgi:hypothetical protein